MAAVSDISARVSKQAGQQQRIPAQIGRLTEANLYRHTIISPPSREAKLKHILDYVDLQRELIALEEDLYQTAIERPMRSSVSPTSNTNTNSNTNNNNGNSRNNPKNDAEMHSRSNTPPALLPRPPPRYTAVAATANVVPLQEDSPSHSRRDLHRQSTPLHFGDNLQQLQQQYPFQQLHQPSSFTLPQPPVRRRSQRRACAPQQQQQQQQLRQQLQQQLDLYPDGLDPRVALPRALPRTMAHHDQSLYRDSFYSGIGQENDWRQLEELDPDSLAGIHLYGDTSDLQLIGQSSLQQQRQQSLPYEMSPAIASSPLNKYPIYELTPARQYLQQHQPPSPFNYRPMHYPGEDEEEEMEVSMATRHRRQQSASMLQQQQLQLQQRQLQQQQLQLQQQQQQQEQHLSRQPSTRERQTPDRQVYSPTSNPVEKEKKQGRFSTRFSFLIRRRQPEQQHQRHESMPGGSARDPWLQTDPQAKYQSLGHLSGRQATMPIDETAEEEEETSQYWQNGHIRVASRIDSPVQPKPKSNNRVKQLFKDVFSRSSKKNATEPGMIQEISLPDTHRATPPPHLQQQRLYGSPSSQLDAATFQSPYSYSTHSMLPPRRALSPVSRPSTAQSTERPCYYPGRASFSHNPIRESLVDPIQYSLSYTNLNPGDENEYLIRNQAHARAHSPYALTSLTPPPANPPPLAIRQSMGPRRSSALPGGMLMSVVTASAAALEQQQFGQDDFLPSEKPQQQQQQQVYKQSLVNNVDRYRARRSSQLIPIPKDNIDSGCDSVGGYEPHATASNATTLHPNLPSAKQESTVTPIQLPLQQQQPKQPVQQQQQNGKQLIHHIPSSSIDFDRDMTLTSTTYDNGPVLVSMAQIQKVDLEGLCAQVSKPYKSAMLSLSVTNPPHITGEDDDEDEDAVKEEDEVIDPKNYHPLHTHPISMVLAVESPYFIA